MRGGGGADSLRGSGGADVEGGGGWGGGAPTAGGGMMLHQVGSRAKRMETRYITLSAVIIPHTSRRIRECFCIFQ